MAYKIELGQDLDEGLYLELAIRNKYNGGYVLGDGVEHQLVIMGWAEDYGRFGEFGQVVASNSNGMITCPAPGIVCIAVPLAALLFSGTPIDQPPATPVLPSPPLGGGPSAPDQGTPISPPYAPFFAVDCERSLRFKILATPLVPQPPVLVNAVGFTGEFSDEFAVTQLVPQPPVFASQFTKTLAKGTISFGGNMPNPRITLMVYPLYPNSPTASVLTCSVAQLKTQLSQLGLYDTVEAALGTTTEQETIQWNTGGDMSLGGPLANRISAILGPAPGAPLDLTALMTAASRTPT